MQYSIKFKRHGENMENNKLSLKSNFSWTIIGNLIYALCQWLILIGISKIGNVLMVGQYSLALAITAPIFMFSSLQLRGILATDKKNSYSFGHYLGLRIITTSISSILLILFLIFSNYPLETKAVILIVILIKAVETISEIIYGLQQKNERMDKISISLIIKGFVSMIVFSIVLNFSRSILISLLCSLLVYILVLIFIDIKQGRKVEKLMPVIRPVKLKKLVILSFPLGLAMLLISLNSNIPKYFIENNLGIKELGYYSAIAYIVIAGSTIINALGQSASPRLAHFFSSNMSASYKSLLFRLLLMSFGIGLLGVIVVIFLGEPILSIIYQSEYRKYNNIFLFVMITALFSYLAAILGYSMTAMRVFKAQPFIFLSVTMITFLASYFLIPTKGLVGATYATIIASVCQVIASLVVNIYFFQRGFKK
jgi:O-antigen/teichoic acid export membrane protein